jgi:molecular chaperone GrpE
MCQIDHDDETTPRPADLAESDTGLWPIPALSESTDIAEPDSESSLKMDIVPEKSLQPGDGAPSVPHHPLAAPDSTMPIIEAIRQLGAQLDQRLVGLQSVFDREIRAETTRERIVDRLHAELQDYKQDLLLKFQRPIFVDLIQLHDDLGKMMESEPTAVADADRSLAVRGILESIRTAIEDILYRQGVEPFQQPGEEFDPRRQRAVSTVPIEDQERNRTVATRLRPGFQAGEKLIRPELVAVYTLKKAQ